MTNLNSLDGMEAKGFRVTLRRDGGPVAVVTDPGTGGPFIFEWHDRDAIALVKTVDYCNAPHEFMGTAEEAAFHAHCIALPMLSGVDGSEWYQRPDIVIGELVRIAQCGRRLSRWFKSKVVFIENGKAYTVQVPSGQTAQSIQAHLREQRTGVVILNTLDLSHAVQLAIAAGL
ncbi:hypothetical protein [Burkholderia cepacia]|uniref:hypothetical protein n=1 Tax=Burkholderia cepacia TaxID=292 RepID=UPI00128E9238|nr:hypothetical protein [Burkholderia cepacia]